MYRNLGITLDKLMALELLKGARVLAGSAGLSNKVTKVNVMEVPDIIDWVSAGELLITTAYSIKDNIHILYELLPKLKEKGVCGLGLKIGRYVKELPQDVIELADSLGFPIVEVPFNVSHTDLISCILAEVFDEQMNMLLRIEAFNNEVMNIMIKGGTLKEIAQMLYDNIGNSLAIYENINDSYEIICNPEDSAIIEGIVHEHIFRKYMLDQDRKEAYTPCWDEIGGRSSERMTIPIIIENVEYGCIFMWKDRKEPTALDNMLIDSYVHVIALDFVKKISLYNVESNYKLEFFDDLLSDNEKRQNRAVERAKNFNYHKNMKHSVIIILLKELYHAPGINMNKVSFVQDAVSSFLFMINRLAVMKKRKIICVDKSDRILILFESDHAASQQAIKNEVLDFCNEIEKEALKKFDGGKFAIGIGKAFEGPGQLWKSHEQARLIVENLNSKGGANVTHYENLGLYKILSFDGMQNELQEFCNDTIKPLLEYDKANNSELVKTLKEYFECDGNMKKLSERMFVHYNTIIYRIQKIEDITGMNLENGDDRLNLQIAFKAMDVIGK